MGPIHKCPFKDNQGEIGETLRMPAHGNSYHLMILRHISYHWIWESGWLKLFAALCHV